MVVEYRGNKKKWILWHEEEELNFEAGSVSSRAVRPERERDRQRPIITSSV